MAAGCIGPHSASLRAGFRFVQDDKSILIKAFEEVVACCNRFHSTSLRAGFRCAQDDDANELTTRRE